MRLMCCGDMYRCWLVQELLKEKIDLVKVKIEAGPRSSKGESVIVGFRVGRSSGGKDV